MLDADSSNVFQKLQQGQCVANSSYQLKNGLLWYNGRIAIPHTSPFKQKIMQEMHSVPTAGHLGVFKTYDKIAKSFY